MTLADEYSHSKFVDPVPDDENYVKERDGDGLTISVISLMKLFRRSLELACYHLLKALNSQVHCALDMTMFHLKNGVFAVFLLIINKLEVPKRKRAGKSGDCGLSSDYKCEAQVLLNKQTMQCKLNPKWKANNKEQ